MAAVLAEQISRLNQAGKMSFKEAMNLRVVGSRQYSRWHVQELITAVGAAGVALIDVAFPGQAAEAQNRTRDGTALPWCGDSLHSWPAPRTGRGCWSRRTGDNENRDEMFSGL